MTQKEAFVKSLGLFAEEMKSSANRLFFYAGYRGLFEGNRNLEILITDMVAMTEALAKKIEEELQYTEAGHDRMFDF